MRWVALGLLALALAIRVAVVVATPDPTLQADPADYQRHAVSIADDWSYPPATRAFDGGTAYRPPGYPVFLGMVYKLTPGESLTTARLAQALVGTLTVGLVGLVAWQLFGPRPGLAATGVAAVFPSMWMIGNALLSEVLLAPLVLAAVAAALRYGRDPRLRWIALAGVLTGLATLTRQNAVLMVVPIALACFPPAARRISRGGLRAAAVLVAATALTIAPWTLRNAVELDSFVPVSTQDGFTLAGTYNDAARNQERWPAAWVRWFDVPENLAAVRGVDNTEVAWNGALRERAIDYAADNPGYVAKVAWWNLRRDFDAAGRDWIRAELTISATQDLADLELISFWLVALLALAGAATRAVRAGPVWPWLVPVTMALTVFIVGYLRFRAPIDPFLAILAGLGFVALLDRVRGRGVSAPPRTA